MKDIVIVVGGLILLALVWVGWTSLHMEPLTNGPVACTADAKLCPDGSYVGRSGPSCAFAACPPAPVSYKDAAYVIDSMPMTIPSGAIKYFGNEATGDLNGDGQSDVAFIITYDGGGSGTFYYAVAALKTGDGYTGTNGVLLGDRIAPQATQIQNGQVIINYSDRKPTDPMTTPPSVGVSKYLKVSGAQLVVAQ